MGLKNLKVLLADDDTDDCLLFKEALEELPLETTLYIVHDGEQLIQYLSQSHIDSPQILFLDLNMPRKNGRQCLAEIKQNRNWSGLKVIIFSTSYEYNTAKQVYNEGANYYIRKPSEFCSLKNVIHKALLFCCREDFSPPSLEEFLIKGDLTTG